MDTAEEAADYDSMDHSEVNRRFVDDFLSAVRASPIRDLLHNESRPVQILDLGTGTAQIPIELCRRPVCCKVTAVDLAGEMLALAARNVAAAELESRIELKRADAKSLPDADATFDAVISNSIVHHIPQPADVLPAMLRVLKPGGLLFLRDLLRPGSYAEVDRLVALYAADANPHQQSLFRASLCAALTLTELRDLLATVSLPAESAIQSSDRHWTISTTKRASG